MIGIQEAFDLLLEETSPVPPEDVPLGELPGRVAARDLTAAAAVPDFRRAMMDGYAVRVEDVAGAAPGEPVRLRVTGRVTAGAAPEDGPAAGEAWEIATGAPLPGGADGVVPYEWTREADGGRRGGAGRRVEVRRPLGAGAKGTNVAPPGEDVEAGTRVLREGRVADARHMAALAAAGVDEVRVRRRPQVAVVSTGDELVPVGGQRGRGQIHDSNSVTLACAVREAGAETVHVGSAPDSEPAIRDELRAAVEASPDVVLTTGGVSVGPRDLVPDVWRGLGVEELFHGVAIKPGKPVFAGDLASGGPDGRSARVVGLSGTPPANAVAYTALVRPMLLRLAGRRHVMPSRVRVRVEEGYPKEADMTRLLWCEVGGEAGEPLDGSLAPVLDHAKLEGICRADALVVMPAGTGPWPPGEVVGGFRLDRPPTEPSFRYRRDDE